MIDIIKYAENEATCTVFDEPIQEYYDIILDAQNDKHRLSSNYRNDILKDMEFMCLFKSVIDGRLRRALFGLQRDPNLPTNVARVFSRFYITQESRSNKHNIKEITKMLSFYTDYPEYHKRLGIDTLFFTREVHGNIQDVLLTRIAESIGYKKIEEPRYYRKTLQHFYVLGNDNNFVTALPFSLVGPAISSDK